MDELFKEIHAMFIGLCSVYTARGFECATYRDSDDICVLQFEKIPHYISAVKRKDGISLKSPGKIEIFISSEMEDVDLNEHIEEFMRKTTELIVENFGDN